MKFTKMHGAGNDYVYVDGAREHLKNKSEAAKIVSDRHFGIGSDGLILINPSDVADFEMEMYNSDGSRGEMCGNGIRCVGKYVYDHGLTDKTTIQVETLAGIRTLELFPGPDGKISSARVDMGEPVLTPADIPVDVKRLSASDDSGDAEKNVSVVNMPYNVAGHAVRITCVSMGNPHCVIFLKDPVDSLKLDEIGPAFEHDPLFPERVNTEFVNVLSPDHVRMRVWERGSGETLACGTGSCAVAVAAILNGYAGRETELTVSLRGGDLRILWDRDTNHVFMTGPAEEVFTGEIELNE